MCRGTFPALCTSKVMAKVVMGKDLARRDASAARAAWQDFNLPYLKPGRPLCNVSWDSSVRRMSEAISR